MTGKLLHVAQRLIKWDVDFPVNCHDGYAGLKELNLIIAEAKLAVIEVGATHADELDAPTPEPTLEAEIQRLRTDRDEWKAMATEYKSLTEEWQARAESKPASTSSPWQDISTAPKDGGEIIARTGPEWAAFSCFWDGSAWQHYDHDDGYIRYVPTEWMPMPVGVSALAATTEGSECE